MLYVESALEQLRNSLDEAGLKYDIEKLDEKSVNINVIKNNIEIKVWFDVDKQIFGFDMLQGGCKTYSDFKEFEKFFGTYLTIYTEFLPSAKAVADEFEKALEINSVYDNFQGNKQTGYIAHFKVLGQDNKVVLISKSPEGFTAKLGVYVDDGTRFKVLTEYKYEVDDVNNVTIIPTIHSYITELSKRYGNNDDIEIERTGVDEFTFDLEGLSIHAKVEIMYRDIKYKVSDISGIAVDFECSLDDPYELSSLYLICKEKYDEIEVEADSKEPEYVDESTDENDSAYSSEEAEYSQEETEYSSEETEYSQEEAEYSSEESEYSSEETEYSSEEAEYSSEETEYVEESVIEDDSIDEDDSEFDSEDVESESEEDAFDDESSDEIDNSFDDETGYESEDFGESGIETSNGVDEDTEVDMDFSVKTIIGIDGNISSLQFMTKDDIFIMSVNKAKELGIPIERITESVSCIKKCGILITEDELARHSFSKDISDNNDMCTAMFNHIFA